MVDDELTLSDLSYELTSSSICHSVRGTRTPAHEYAFDTLCQKTFTNVCAAMNNPSESGHVQCFYVSLRERDVTGGRGGTVCATLEDTKISELFLFPL